MSLIKEKMKIMKTLINNLHSALRTWCITNYELFKKEYIYWSEKYHTVLKQSNARTEIIYCIELEKLLDYTYRWQFSKDTLIQLEKYVPEDFETLNELKTWAIEVCEEMQLIIRDSAFKYYNDKFKNIVYTSFNDEKRKFLKYIVEITIYDLKNVKPLFYRRVLTKKEYIELNQSSRIIPETFLKYDTNSDRYYYDDAIIAHVNFIKKNIPLDIIRKLLIKNKIYKVYELNQHDEDPSYEIDTNIFDLKNRLISECLWVSKEMNWMIKYDHEDYVYIYGTILIDDLYKEIYNLESLLDAYYGD